MIRKTLNLYFLVLLLLINGCGFKPILVGSDYNFTIRVEESIGNTEINSKIENKLKKLEGINRTFNAIINSEEIKNILSKDSKGDPAILEIIINLNYKLTENSKVLVNRSVTQRSTYNNITDKFELSKSEEILKDNLVENLVSDIINSASNLILNPMVNDN
tara:strand:+ start:1273 stop:1755 length:483 start_codon:yes stop_codon:yes gene_type:complete